MSMLEHIKERKKLTGTLFFAMIAELDLVAKNLLNIFFITRYIGDEGAAAYEVIMPCVMLSTAFVAMSYNGVQAMCSKDYGAGNMQAFKRHKNAGYTFLLTVMTVLTLIFALFKMPVLDLLGANEGSESFALLCRDCYSVFLFCFIPQSIFSIAGCLLFFEERRRLLAVNLILYFCMFAGNILVTKTEPTMTGYVAVNVISVFAADAYLILYCFVIRRKNSLAAFTAFDFRLSDIKPIILTGFPDFMEYGFAALFYLVQNLYMLSRFSPFVVAGTGVFEAVNNIPEMICVFFGFLSVSSFGMGVGRLIGAYGEQEYCEEEQKLLSVAKKLTRGAVAGSLMFGGLLIVFARPLVELFLTEGGSETRDCAVLCTVSCGLGFVFYMLNTEIVSYYKIVGAYIKAHIVFFAEALAFPVIFMVLFGELFGVTGFCLSGFVAEMFVFIMNLLLVRMATGKFPLSIKDFKMGNYPEKPTGQQQ